MSSSQIQEEDGDETMEEEDEEVPPRRLNLTQFENLLKPIKQLAKNWNIDISTELTGAENLDFREAAILIQNSTFVYGKKVEHLYSMVFSVLEKVMSQIAQKKVAASKKGDAVDEENDDSKDGSKKPKSRKRKKDETEASLIDELLNSKEPNFLPLDDIVENQQEKQNNSKILSVSGMNGGEAPKNDTNNSENFVLPQITATNSGFLQTELNSHLAGFGELGNNNTALKLTTCTIHPSGALLLKQDDELLLNPSSNAQNPENPQISSDLNISMSKKPENPDLNTSMSKKAAVFQKPADDSDSDDDNFFIPNNTSSMNHSALLNTSVFPKDENNNNNNDPLTDKSHLGVNQNEISTISKATPAAERSELFTDTIWEPLDPHTAAESEIRKPFSKLKEWPKPALRNITHTFPSFSSAFSSKLVSETDPKPINVMDFEQNALILNKIFPSVFIEDKSSQKPNVAQSASNFSMSNYMKNYHINPFFQHLSELEKKRLKFNTVSHKKKQMEKKIDELEEQKKKGLLYSIQQQEDSEGGAIFLSPNATPLDKALKAAAITVSPSLTQIAKQQEIIQQEKSIIEQELENLNQEESNFFGVDFGGPDDDEDDYNTIPVNENNPQTQSDQVIPNILTNPTAAPPQTDTAAPETFDLNEAEEFEKGKNESLQNVIQIYKDLCRKYLEESTAVTEKYLQEKKLIDRVNEWTKNLMPMLEREEKKELFDMEKYSQKLLRNFGNEGENKPFADLVIQKPKYEVARLFLATLQLANNGNFEIIPPTSEEDAGTFSVKMLSKKLKAIKIVSPSEN